MYLASTELEVSATVTVSLVSDSMTPPSPPPSLLLLPPPPPPLLLVLDLLPAKERALAAMLRLAEREVLLWTDPSVKMPLELLVTIPPSLLREDQLM